MKKLGIALGLLLSFFVALALIVPLVVNVDKYRPQIVEAANKQINGKLELGKLSLSLWGQIRVEVGGLKLLGPSGREVVGVQDAYFHLPFLPILSGSPVVTFKMRQPVVTVIKNKAGKLNVMSVMKDLAKAPEGKPAKGVQPSQQPATPQPSSPSSLPAIATRARLGVELRQALITYKDEGTGLSTQVKDLNFILRDISLSHPTELELWADLDTKMGKSFLLQGPARMVGKAQTILTDGILDHVSLTSKLDMDGVEMSVPGTFQKKKGVPMNVELALTGSGKEAKIEKLTAQFFNAEVNAQGTVTNLTPSAPGGAANPIVNLTVKSNEIELRPWVELLPMLKDYQLGGSAKLEAGANGPSQKLGYHAKLNFNNITAKAPHLKTQPKINGVISVVTDQVDQVLITMAAPANDLKIQGKVVSFTKPRVDFEVTSTGMDLDQMIEFPPPPPPEPKAKAAAPAAPVPTEGAPAVAKRTAQTAAAEDYDAMLAPLRENKILGDLVAHLSINMKMIKAKGVKVSDLNSKLSFKDLTAGIDHLGMKIFSGSIQADSHLQMKPKTPTYQFNGQVSGLNLSQAVESQMALFKDTVTGIANFTMKGQGASLNPDPAISNLNANGNFKVTEAGFATIDVSKMVSEALNKALGQVGDKIPALKGKSIAALPAGAGKFESISSDFTLSGGKFSAPNFLAKAVPNKGVDIKGNTTVDLKTYALNASWDVVDTYNLTHARDLSVEQSGIRVDHILAEGNSPVHFPVRGGCTVMAPCFTYTDVATSLASVALNNVNSALTGAARAAGAEAAARARELARKQAESAIKQAPPAVQNKLNELLRR